VDSLIPILLEHLAYLPEYVPVVLYLLDNSCFKALNETGDLSSITRRTGLSIWLATLEARRENKDFGPNQNAISGEKINFLACFF
jgi:hypothetical protein